MSVLALLMAAVLILSAIFSDTISLFLYGIGDQTADAEVLSGGTALCEDIVEEGIVLLKNSVDGRGNPALPLTDEELSQINVFGWAAYDWMTSAFGSGFSNTSLEKVKLFPALEEAGIAYNPTLYNMYETFYSHPASGWGMTLAEYRGDVDVGTTAKFILHEPGESYYTNNVVNEATAFSDVALVVIGRMGGEAADLRMEQTKQIQTNNSNVTTVDTSRHYLQLSTEEEEMIAAAKKACGKVIVVLNTSNTMETGFLDDEEIDGALLVGLTGLTGVRSLVDVLRGWKDVETAGEDGTAATERVPVSPSGRTADTYAYDIFTAPSSVNSGFGGATKYAGLSSSSSYTKGYFDAYMDYCEGIYVGYRWYETAAQEGYLDYRTAVQYPFGYGLSYTDFEWSVSRILINGEEQSYNAVPTLGENDEIELYVSVKNIGATAGKDVVELYYTAPYTPGGIEKAHVNLGAFAKTPVIEPGQSRTVALTLNVQSMASYDCYDANGNGHTGYELDGGAYVLRLMKNSHESGNMAADSRIGAEITYQIPETTYNVDAVTGNPVRNRFTGEDAIDNADLDGSHETLPVTYLSRADFAGTFPREKVLRERSEAAFTVASAMEPTAEQLARTGYADLALPETGAAGGLLISDMVGTEDYENADWSVLISQISTKELFELVRNGYFKTAALDSVGKPEYTDLDGPLGLNTRVTSNASCEFVAYPSETMVAQTWNVDLAYAVGLSVGTEAQTVEALKGWYGPAANLHRNPFGGRNGEYYSEDPLLSGALAAATVRGAKDMGLYSYLKHFAANDSESLREGLYTFMTEQTLREIYLRPFELAVKEGGGNALMTSMNRLGRVWSGSSRALCTEILRDEWGFRGTLVTDWVDTGSTYMPVFRGIWAGNDIWLNNANATKMFNDADYSGNAGFVALAQNVAHDVLWTLIDTENTRLSYDPDAAPSNLDTGFTYNHTWYWYIAAFEFVCAVGLSLTTVSLVKKLKKVKTSGGKSAERKGE